LPFPEVALAVRIIIGLALTAIAFALTGRRLRWLARVARTGQPAPERIEAVRKHPGRDAEVELTEVLGQRRLLQWSVPGLAHALTFWGFIVLILTLIEAYGDLFSRTFAIPLIGHWAFIGFIEDLFAVLVLAGIITFAVIRLRSDPEREGRRSRFAGSHTGAAWLVLGMIFLVIATLLIARGAQINTGVFPYQHGAFASQLVGHWLAPLGHGTNDVLETVFVLAQLAVVLAFLVLVVNSKHLHIFLAPLNVLFSRRPDGLRELPPMRSNGKVLDFEEADPDSDVFGTGKIEDFSWKAMLDMATCTECGRCQSQCPAWNTGKPLSPKMVMLDLRDHALAKAPYLLAGSDEARQALPDAVRAEADRPLVGDQQANGVIDPDVLWSCTNCGACVRECPVDIEHIDHITSMRRHQVLIESDFPAEASTMLKNLENKGDPWGMGASHRLDWTESLDFEVPVVDGPIADDVQYLFWVGCAGALEDRARRTTRAIVELLHTAGVKFAVLGPGETCTGDPARRMGNEFVFAMLAQQNIETLNEAGARTIVASCPHCFNTLANEYGQLGGSYQVIHHTQLLARLLAEGRLTPVTAVNEKITYHDPCFLGRHNKVFTPPREIMERVPGVRAQEMHRCRERGFCCGAGGARMWMEERIGKRINEERIDEALGTNPDTVSTACPYCLVMLGDAISAKKSSGQAAESLEIVDVAQLLARSVRSTPAAGNGQRGPDGPAQAPEQQPGPHVVPSGETGAGVARDDNPAAAGPGGDPDAGEPAPPRSDPPAS
jgi:Fe-S oxidoreductase